MLIVCGLNTATTLRAGETDSLKVIDMEEVVIIAAPKENRKLREQPTSVTMLSQDVMQRKQINSIKQLASVVPNLFIPDYGSKLTSAIYIRGIGSRINTPAVGLYVDNVPYIDKSAFDFNYYDIERMEVLRGVQSTLYGRNTMAGLIKVHTKSPFSYQGTDIKVNAGTHNNYSMAATHYHRISDFFAFSAGGFYSYSGGQFTNSYTGDKADRYSEAGGRIRGIYFFNEDFKADWSLSYEYTDQDGYPYFYTGRVNGVEENRQDYIGKISTDQESSYRRNLLNSGLTLSFRTKDVMWTAVTGYQFLSDRMLLDNDFTEVDIFLLEQKQRQHAITEEIVAKSSPQSRWQWTNGFFATYQWLKTNAPVTFGDSGIRSLIEENANANFPSSPAAPAMALSIQNTSLRIGDDFSTPTLNAALYHQSTYNDVLTKGLSVTAGIRFDYERIKMSYHSSSTPLDFTFSMQMPNSPITFTDEMQATTLLSGSTSHNYWQVLPKFALQYEWGLQNNVYATTSRGYRSGGYNIQTFSDMAQLDLRNGMKDALINSSVFSSYEAIITAMMPDFDINPSESTRYKPEYSWNYELGTHLNLYNRQLQIDLAGFYMDTKDQQISRFVESGAGRIMINAGRSRSIGAEAAITAYLTQAWALNTSYGYTQATFRDYLAEGKDSDGNEQNINYRGNYVPFTPMHTFHLSSDYAWALPKGIWFNTATLTAYYNGAANIYWTEQNNTKESFYGTLGAQVAFKKDNLTVNIWGKNLLNKAYTTFYFESMNNGFMQKGKPIQVGVEIRWTL